MHARGDRSTRLCTRSLHAHRPGKNGGLTPDIRKGHMLYDSTVNWTMKADKKDPSIFVTYHDAQAYPE